MLNNPFYIGLIQLRRTQETFPGAHQPLIKKALFDRVQRILSGKVRSQGYKHQFQFRRLLKCGNCSYSLIRERQKGHIYYRCHSKDCPTTGIREEQVLGQILDEIRPLEFSREERAYIQTSVTRLRDDWENQREKQITHTSLLLGQLKERLPRISDIS